MPGEGAETGPASASVSESPKAPMAEGASRASLKQATSNASMTKASVSSIPKASSQANVKKTSSAASMLKLPSTVSVASTASKKKLVGQSSQQSIVEQQSTASLKQQPSTASIASTKSKSPAPAAQSTASLIPGASAASLAKSPSNASVSSAIKAPGASTASIVAAEMDTKDEQHEEDTAVAAPERQESHKSLASVNSSPSKGAISQQENEVAADSEVRAEDEPELQEHEEVESKEAVAEETHENENEENQADELDEVQADPEPEAEEREEERPAVADLQDGADSTGEDDVQADQDVVEADGNEELAESEHAHVDDDGDDDEEESPDANVDDAMSMDTSNAVNEHAENTDLEDLAHIEQKMPEEEEQVGDEHEDDHQDEEEDFGHEANDAASEGVHDTQNVETDVSTAFEDNGPPGMHDEDTDVDDETPRSDKGRRPFTFAAQPFASATNEAPIPSAKESVAGAGDTTEVHGLGQKRMTDSDLDAVLAEANLAGDEDWNVDLSDPNAIEHISRNNIFNPAATTQDNGMPVVVPSNMPADEGHLNQHAKSKTEPHLHPGIAGMGPPLGPPQDVLGLTAQMIMAGQHNSDTVLDGGNRLTPSHTNVVNPYFPQHNPAALAPSAPSVPQPLPGVDDGQNLLFARRKKKAETPVLHSNANDDEEETASRIPQAKLVPRDSIGIHKDHQQKRHEDGSSNVPSTYYPSGESSPIDQGHHHARFQDPRSVPQIQTGARNIFEAVRHNVVGAQYMHTSGPFGSRQFVYPYTSDAARPVTYIEDFVRNEVLPGLNVSGVGDDLKEQARSVIAAYAGARIHTDPSTYDPLEDVILFHSAFDSMTTCTPMQRIIQLLHLNSLGSPVGGNGGSGAFASRMKRSNSSQMYHAQGGAMNVNVMELNMFAGGLHGKGGKKLPPLTPQGNHDGRQLSHFESPLPAPHVILSADIDREEWEDTHCNVSRVGYQAVNGKLNISQLEVELNKCPPNCPLKLVVLKAVSSAFHVAQDTHDISSLCHEYGAFVIWDYRDAAEHLPVEMNGPAALHTGAPGSNSAVDVQFGKDGVILAPSRFVGGPGAAYVIIVKRHLLDLPNGGSMSSEYARYLSQLSLSEPADPATVLECVRAGLAVQLPLQVAAAKANGSQHGSVLQSRAQKLHDVAVEHLRRSKMIKLLLPSHAKAARAQPSRASKNGAASSSSIEFAPMLDFVITTGKNGSKFVHYKFVEQLAYDLFGITVVGSAVKPTAPPSRLYSADYMKKIVGAFLESAGPGGSVQGSVRHAIAATAGGVQGGAGGGKRGSVPSGYRVGFNTLFVPYYVDEALVKVVCDCIIFIAENAEWFMRLYGFDEQTGEWYAVHALTPKRRPMPPPRRGSMDLSQGQSGVRLDSITYSSGGFHVVADRPESALQVSGNPVSRLQAYLSQAKKVVSNGLPKSLRLSIEYSMLYSLGNLSDAELQEIAETSDLQVQLALIPMPSHAHDALRWFLHPVDYMSPAHPPVAKKGERDAKAASTTRARKTMRGNAVADSRPVRNGRNAQKPEKPTNAKKAGVRASRAPPRAQQEETYDYEDFPEYDSAFDDSDVYEAHGNHRYPAAKQPAGQRTYSQKTNSYSARRSDTGPGMEMNVNALERLHEIDSQFGRRQHPAASKRSDAYGRGSKKAQPRAAAPVSSYAKANARGRR